MASTYSTSLRLELIGTGEQSGTWGTTTNTNLGTLLEQAIGGYQSVTMTDADYTLSTANGVVDEARNAVLRFTGTLTAARNVLCPDGIEKVYIVENATTNGFAITFKTVSGTGISIPNGAEAILFADGTNVRMVTNITSAGAALLDDADAAAQRTTLGLGTGDSPQFTAVNIGNASDTTLSRVSAGVAAIEGKNIALNGTSETFTTGTIELGNASDTTITRSAAGVIAVEGGIVPKENRTNTFTASQTFSSLANSFVTASGGVGINIDSAAATFRVAYFKTAGLNRWALGADNSAESGSNAGTGLFIYRYDDAGAYLGAPLYIDRATGQTTLSSLNCATIEVGNTDTTITRSAAGVIAVEGGVIPKENRANTFSANQIISVTDNTNAALRVTQLGTGNAILVEDSTNPDATPFVVDSNGRIIAGHTSSINFASGYPPQIQNMGSTAQGSTIGTGIFSADANGGALAFLKSRSTTVGTVGTIVNSGDLIGSILFFGDDGSVGRAAASINGLVGGTPGASDMPGLLTFATTADGAFVPTERMRIDSAGNVGIGTSSPGTKLDVNGNINSSGTIQSAGGVTFRKTANISVTNALTLGTVSKSTVPTGGQGSILIYSDDATNPLQGSVSLITSATASERRLAIGAIEQSVAFRDITLAELGGNVGIGKTPVNGMLDVNGRVSAATGYSLPNDQPIFWGPGDGTTSIYGNSTSDFIYFNTAGAERLRITSAGNVGIGTSSPQGRLVVDGGYAGFAYNSNGTYPSSTAYFSAIGHNFSGGLSEVNLWNNTGGGFSFMRQTGASSHVELFTIAGSGNVGIGTTSPNAKLDVNGVIRSGNVADIVEIGQGWVEITATTSTPFIDFKSSSAEDFDCRIQQVSNGLIFATGGNGSSFERMRIDASGRLLVGTSTALDATGIVPLVQSATADNQAGFGAFRYSNNAPGPLLHFFKSRGTTVGTNTIVQNGDVLGNIAFYGADGTNEILGANVQAVVDGAPGANDMPTRLEFATTSDGASTTTVRFRISANGDTLNVSTGGLGYGTGSGGAVTQATSRTTGVTLNKTNGAITLVSAAGSAAWQSFTVTNSTVAATDTIIVSQKSGTDLYMISVTAVAAGSFRISFATTGGTTTEQPVFNFAVIKAVTA